ncbi:MAG: response regulator [Candidatus Omnitrophica bacterium]|nr:response regulator [Candidatus Omnitrophota bacterium]
MEKSKTILVVDDEPNLVLFFKDFFRRDNCNVLYLEDPKKAVLTANTVHPDLLIMDPRLPKIDPTDVLQKIREKTPEIKTIILSTHLAELRQKIEEFNAQAILEKPVRFEELERWILKLLASPSRTRPEMRILFVDDEKEIVEAISDTYREYGFLIDTASSGEEGLEKSKTKPYDILITDISMGDMSGYDMIKKMRLESKYKPRVMAVFSAHLTSALKAKYHALGVLHFLDKPVRLEDMLHWLESQSAEIMKEK